MSVRINAGFQIVDSIFIGESEFVLGVNKATPTMYVTWKCADGANYYWGHYHTDQIAAKKDLLKRALEELDAIEQRIGNMRPQKERDDAR